MTREESLAQARNQLDLIDALKKTEAYRQFLEPMLKRLADEALSKTLEEGIDPAERERRFQRYAAYRDVSEIVDKQEGALQKNFVIKKK